MSDNQREIADLEADIQEFEEMIREEEKSLAYLESEDYKPEDNPDHEFRDQDIEENNSTIAEYRQNIAKCQRKIESLKSAQQCLQADGLPHSD